ncbi:hypothetical protein AB8919_10955 [Yersinia enterocolitica]|uniref:hypothetical protein n=1 Tax=Yersinia enterocolitica TaxID=630 RepID=UPI003D08B762|nr:hypothetical protein [Yersinia enterocolitica]
MTPQMKDLAEQLIGCVNAISKTKSSDKKEELSHDFIRLMKELAALGVAVIPPSPENTNYQFIWQDMVLSLSPSGFDADLNMPISY